VPLAPFNALTLARILRPWGRRGEVAAEILTDNPEHLTGVSDVWLSDRRGEPRPAHIKACRIHLGQAVLLFEGVDTITGAERLRGLEVQVSLAERAALPPGHHYISDLVGCSIFNQGTAALIGSVSDVRNAAAPGAPAAWLLVVTSKDNTATDAAELLVPLAAEICTLIDTAARRIEVRLPEGLRKLNQK
jgi:16S rRNA processing protein RimM